MPLERDDPKLTAYALGELDPSERAGVRDAIAGDRGLREQVEEIQAAARMLTQALAAEPRTEPGIELSEMLPLKASSARKPVAGLRKRLVIGGAVAAAACVFLAFALIPAPDLANHQARSREGVAALRGGEHVDGWEGYMKQQAERSAAEAEFGIDSNAMHSPAETGRANLGSLRESFRNTHPETRSYEAFEFAPVEQRIKQRRPIDGTVFEAENSGEAYASIRDNEFLSVKKAPLSTFSIDVDTAAYANIRRFLNEGTRPPKDAVRIEEMINYFPYEDPQPRGDDPFSINVEIAQCPWKLDHRLVRIGLKGKDIAWENVPPSNLVFLIDVSGSMDQPNKLPLVRSALRMLVEKLRDKDRVAIVVYAGSEGLALAPTPCSNKRAIIAAIESLTPGGSTNGSGGIQLAYDMARSAYIDGGNNRVILATDGDFNVGITDPQELTRLIEAKAKSGVFLSVLGFGMGNLKDATLEQLADKGNGNYSYIDTLSEARKVLVEQMAGTLATIAKDVKIQAEFNPARVKAYRLIGYENRLLRARDFNDDSKDAGEIGAGHTVTALYEVIPAGSSEEVGGVDPLKYQSNAKPQAAEAEEQAGVASRETLTVKLRFKPPAEATSKLIERGVVDAGKTYSEAAPNLQFAAAVAAFGMILRDSPHKGSASLEGVIELARAASQHDPGGHRKEFVELVEKARALGSH